MVSAKKTYEIMDHTADLGILVSGEDLRDLFQNAAGAMMEIMLDPDPEQHGSLREISIEGTDLADLMVRWLGEILYLFEGDNRVVIRTKIRDITPHYLTARVETVPFSLKRHELLTEIKAVTYHQIQVQQEETGQWKAMIIFDL